MVTTVPLLFDKLIGDMFISIMGNPVLIGLFAMFFFFVLGLALRLTLEIQLLMMYFLALIVISSLITWLPFAITFTLGILIGVFLFNMIFRG